MSPEPRQAFARGLQIATALLLFGLAAGCGSGDPNAKHAGRPSADTAQRAPGTQAASSAAPTPGFTSAQGTPAAQPGSPTAPTVVAARMAPPPSAELASAIRDDEQTAIRALPAGAGRDLVVGSCLTCHAATLITQQHKDTAGWNKTITQMIAWGAAVPKDRNGALVAYLAEQFPARTAAQPARQGTP